MDTTSISNPAYADLSLDLSPDAHTEPCLPSEIEYEIFMMAYHNTAVADRLNLLQVAKRVYAWLIPLLYRTVAINGNHQSKYPNLDILKRLGSHVRYIYVSQNGSSMDISALVSSCPHIVNLSFWYHPTEIPEIFHLPLKRLSVYDLEIFEKQLTNALASAHKAQVQKWCSNITHLAWGRLGIDLCRDLAPRFPNVTHFLLGEWNSKDVILEVLKSCPRLQVMIRLLASFESTGRTFVEDDLDPVDIRVVTVNACLSSDWIRGREGEDDMWVIAERKVKERRECKGWVGWKDDLILARP
ncbi:hypothetical protein BDN72DRAFT_135425 [Pluteus cervinus]|uniref:Uncharacterized protein n=1 Tax=Pluteus cervinus TaxID=181527 RepID=A0ACD3B8B3_9AGAR|nr:hypothetical protein BDN72DRAFT_135425 [Pluteus cervinus]